MQFKVLLLGGCLIVALAARVFAHPGVVTDPDGFTYLRAGKGRESAIVTKVNAGEVIDFKHGSDTEWCEVTLASGKKGYMHFSRIRLHATMADLADAPADDEIHIFARRSGLDIYPVARAAAKGDTAAMKSFFEFKSDGAAMETHDALYLAVIHLLGDEKLAKFLRQQPVAVHPDIRERIENSSAMPFEAEPYLKRHFPKTAAILFR